MTEEATYRDSHAAEGYGSRYDSNYSSGYYAAIYREIEVPTLDGLFSALSEGGRDTLLDFACGTGRITRLAVPHFGRVVGVDVSEAMLRNAETNAPGAQYVRQDLTKKPLGEKFSVITAFRFFLNAEQGLRLQALAAIREHMAPNGRLVCNIHMNSRSIMGGVYGLARLVPGVTSHNTLSYRQFEEILAKSGFVVEKVIWYGMTPRPGRLFGRFLDRSVGPIERFLKSIGLTGPLAHSFIVVARLADSDPQTAHPA